jgi:hypothetical protein
VLSIFKRKQEVHFVDYGRFAEYMVELEKEATIRSIRRNQKDKRSKIIKRKMIRGCK